MDAHLFRRFANALSPFLVGARVEKIHEPAPFFTAFTLYMPRMEKAKKQYLVLHASRKNPWLFCSPHKVAANSAPPASAMRLRKYLSDRRVEETRVDITSRTLYLHFFFETPLWLALDLREGPRLLFEDPPAFFPQDDETLWPQADSVETFSALWQGDLWKNYPLLTPALRRTLPHMDPLETLALWEDLRVGDGDVFLYKKEKHLELSAWPLPAPLRKDMQEEVWEGAENVLAACALVGELEVYGQLQALLSAKAQKPFEKEYKRLEKLEEKLQKEEDRLVSMQGKKSSALLLQQELYRFGEEEKQAEVEIEGEKIPLDPRLTVRANMAALFHEAGRGKRGLEHLEKRRQAVSDQKEAAQDSALASAALSGGAYGDGAGQAKSRAQKNAARQAGAQKNQADAAKGKTLPKQVQAFRSSDGFVLLRGRDTKGNALVLKMAAPHDFWLHTALGPSAHVIIRRDHPTHEVPARTFQEAGALVMQKSWLKDEEKADIQYSQAKYIRMMKNAPSGTVRIDQSEGAFAVIMTEELRTFCQNT